MGSTTTRHEHLRWALLLLVLSVVILAVSPAAQAGPVSGSVGFDYSSGPEDQVTRAALGVAGVGGKIGDVFVSGIRYDNNVVGPGLGGVVGLGLTISPAWQLRASATRFVGDQDYRDWRFKAGPLVSLPRDASLGIYYTRDESNAAPHFDAGTAEAGLTLPAGFASRASIGVASAADGTNGWQASMGLSWSPVPLLELSGEVGLAEDAFAAGSRSAPTAGLRLPLLGGPSPDPTEQQASDQRHSTTASLGVRVRLP